VCGGHHSDRLGRDCWPVGTVLETNRGCFHQPSRGNFADSKLDSVRGRLTATNITVRELIRFAYGVKDFQIESAPKWIDSERFDIVAKSVSSQEKGLEDEKSLIRELLADRFQLTTHHESKQVSFYVLVVPKGAPKLQPHNDAVPKTRGACGRVVGRRVTADKIASMLARQVDREVLNRTGLSGEFDIQLDFAPDSGNCPSAADAPSLYTEIQQQLGLKMESGKGTVEVLVVDRVERASEDTGTDDIRRSSVLRLEFAYA
jgi:uncharacterized protein (TIGR03435 family)